MYDCSPKVEPSEQQTNNSLRYLYFSQQTISLPWATAFD